MKSKLVSNEFDIKLQPQIVQDYIEECLKSAPGMDPLMVTLPFLVSTGAMLLHKVSMYNFQRIWTNSWVLMLAPSGTGKSHAMRLGCQIARARNNAQQERLMGIDEKINKIVSLPRNEQKEEQTKLEGLRNLRKQCFLSDPIIADKVTTEGLLDILNEGQRGAIYASEAQLWYSQYEKDYNKDLRYEILKTYDGIDPIPYKKANSTLYIKEPVLSFIGASTFEAIRPYFSSDEFKIGTLTRTLIYAFGQCKPREIFASTDNNKINSLNTKIDQMLLSLPTMEFMFSREAAEIYNQIGLEISSYKHEHDRVNTYFDSFKPRYMENILKFSMILSVLDNPHSCFITDKSVLAAYNLILPAAHATLHIICDFVGLSPFQLNCTALLKWITHKFIEAEGKAITYQQVVNSDVLGGNTDEYNKVLKMLCYQEKLMIRETFEHKEEFIDVDKLLKPRNYQTLSFCPFETLYNMALKKLEEDKEPSKEGDINYSSSSSSSGS